MPKLVWPSEEEASKYVKEMRDKLKNLDPGKYRGFFRVDSPEVRTRDVAYGALSTAMYSYIKHEPNGLSRDDRIRLYKMETPLFLSGAQVPNLKDNRLKHLLDLKHLMESTADNGRTHFENIMDFAYASEVSKETLTTAVQAMNEDLGLNLKVPKINLERVPNPTLQGRKDEIKSGLDWISEFKASARQNAAAQGKERDTDWVINTLAVRSLVNSERHKSSRLKDRKLKPAEIIERANRLMADPGVRGYINALKTNPQEYARAAELLQKGNGGKLEDQLTAFLVADKKVPFTSLGMRYRPTAKQFIELMQGRLKNPESTPAEKQEALASIIAVRKTMDIKRATMGLMGDDVLKQQIRNYTGVQEQTEKTLQDLKKLSSEAQSSLMEAACSGHGGAMVQSYDKLLKQAGVKPLLPQVEHKESEVRLPHAGKN